jgi:S-ribosylhomocysteine lyase LuxS involved in autoinducer biosynthesis
VLAVYERILREIVAAREVPYADIHDCGHWENHDLGLAKAVAQHLLDSRAAWRQVL